MRRRRWRLLVLGLLSLTLVGTAGLYWLAPSRPQITWSSYGRIERDMMLAKVEALIGAPPGEYGVPEPWQHLSGDSQMYFDALPEDCRYVTWVSPVCTIGVYLDSNDRIIGKDIAVDPRPWWERLVGFGESPDI